jgi:hypothetical protein
MGTEDEVREHEEKCIKNYNRRSCFTCKHKTWKSIDQYECDLGNEIPKGQIFEFCGQYEREEKKDYPLTNLFGTMFGGF